MRVFYCGEFWRALLFAIDGRGRCRSFRGLQRAGDAGRLRPLTERRSGDRVVSRAAIGSASYCWRFITLMCASGARASIWSRVSSAWPARAFVIAAAPFAASLGTPSREALVECWLHADRAHSAASLHSPRSDAQVPPNWKALAQRELVHQGDII